MQLIFNQAFTETQLPCLVEHFFFFKTNLQSNRFVLGTLAVFAVPPRHVGNMKLCPTLGQQDRVWGQGRPRAGTGLMARRPAQRPGEGGWFWGPAVHDTAGWHFTSGAGCHWHPAGPGHLTLSLEHWNPRVKCWRCPQSTVLLEGLRFLKINMAGVS